MPLSAEQATKTLRDLEAVAHRSSQLHRYQRVAPMLMLWGVIWLIGFGLTDIMPARAGFIWIALDLAGTLGCIFLSTRGKHEKSTGTTWRWVASIVTIFAFFMLLQIIFQPVSGAQSAALAALIVSLFYVLSGLWLGARFAVAGLSVAALTLLGYFTLGAHFYLWMAVVGGGALMLAGLWLRRV